MTSPIFRKSVTVCSTRHVTNLLKMYREIQIHCCIYNQIHKHTLMLLHILCGLVCSSYSTFVLMTGYSQLHFIEIMIFASSLSLGTILLLLGLHYPSKLLRLSVKTLRILRNAWSLNKRRVSINTEYLSECMAIKKSFKSLPTISIKYLQTSRFDKLTPLVLFKFSIRTAINMVLIDK